jgi:hypothetical protein
MTAMQFHELPDERQSDTEAAAVAVRTGLAVTKHVKNPCKKVGGYSHLGVHNFDAHEPVSVEYKKRFGQSSTETFARRWDSRYLHSQEFRPPALRAV